MKTAVTCLTTAEIQKPLKPEPQSKATVMKIDQFRSSIIKSEPESKIYGINGRRIKHERVKEGIYFINTESGTKKIVIIK